MVYKFRKVDSKFKQIATDSRDPDKISRKSRMEMVNCIDEHIPNLWGVKMIKSLSGRWAVRVGFDEKYSRFVFFKISLNFNLEDDTHVQKLDEAGGSGYYPEDITLMYDNKVLLQKLMNEYGMDVRKESLCYHLKKVVILTFNIDETERKKYVEKKDDYKNMEVWKIMALGGESFILEKLELNKDTFMERVLNNDLLPYKRHFDREILNEEKFFRMGRLEEKTINNYFLFQEFLRFQFPGHLEFYLKKYKNDGDIAGCLQTFDNPDDEVDLNLLELLIKEKIVIRVYGEKDSYHLDFVLDFNDNMVRVEMFINIQRFVKNLDRHSIAGELLKYLKPSKIFEFKISNSTSCSYFGDFKEIPYLANLHFNKLKEELMPSDLINREEMKNQQEASSLRGVYYDRSNGSSTEY
jgi:hypothetical protein